MDINTVGVVGAGTMGVGLAQVLASSGMEVLLLDKSTDILEEALGQVAQGLRLQTLLNRQGLAPRGGSVVNRITTSVDFEVLRSADFVIENVTENWAVKREVYKVMDSVCSARTIFAANTSAIPITRIASATGRAPQVLGMHFMNPVPMKRMVEVIRGYHTSDATVDAAKGLLARLRKDYVVVNDSPGFVSNRVLMLTINEAVFLVQEGVASAEEVDLIFRECFGHKMGPLETADLIGLDTILYSVEVLQESFSDDKYRPCPLLRKMVDAGLLGRKSGRGFYSHGAEAVIR